jgi:hypothetical protein
MGIFFKILWVLSATFWFLILLLFIYGLGWVAVEVILNMDGMEVIKRLIRKFQHNRNWQAGLFVFSFYLLKWDLFKRSEH